MEVQVVLLVKKLLLVLGVVLCIQLNGSKGCFEEERLALLLFKTSLQSDLLFLPSWVNDDPTSDCCTWDRVTCNSTTGRVIQLSLNGTQDEYFYYDDYYCDERSWSVNISMFQQIKELKSLDLSSNGIAGFIDKQGFQELSSLKKLEILNLSDNCFNNITSIFSSLSALTSLKTLIFAWNRNLDGSFPIQELSHLENLEMLDLSVNDLNITKPIPDFKSLSKLRKLKHLDLSYNRFDDVILNVCGMFSSLETLDLSGNSLEWPHFIQERSKLNNLSVLNLRNIISWNATVPAQDLKSLSKLRKLKHLDLSYNSFDDVILNVCGMFSSLETLDLSFNSLKWQHFIQELSNLNNLTVLKLASQHPYNATVPAQSLCVLKSLKKLQHLDLSWNSFGGSLPPCLNNLTSLTYLDLSHNQFTGQISSLSTLCSLENINFSNNFFEGNFSFEEFGNHSSLKVVQFISDNSKFEVEANYGDWIPPFDLEMLVLQNCGLEAFPEFLFHQSRLRMVDLAHNKIKEEYPNWLIKNNTGLVYLSFKNNSLMGEFHLPTNNIIPWIDVSSNNLSGQLHETQGKIFPKMKFLRLSGNHFEGEFPFSSGHDCQLTSLDLSSNNFTGEIPKELVSSCIYLEYLILSHNNFQGQIFTSGFNLTYLSRLQLSDNKFVGTLSSDLVHVFDGLSVLDVSNNYFHGEIPIWMRNITHFGCLFLRGNHFKGQISCELLSHHYSDLSSNLFSGPLPSCFNLPYERGINLGDNRFSGSVPKAFFNSSLELLNLRDNNLSGSIPNRLDKIPNLGNLSLGGNHLNGVIPNWLCQLYEINILDLSSNSFSGPIPHCFYNLSFVSEAIDDYYTEGSILGETVDFPMTVDLNIGFDIKFVTKHIAYTYKGRTLNYMCGLDLSDNDLIGEIPFQFGNLSLIRALNLSHNRLVGSVPKSFSNLSLIESLDLSHNNLSGEIPSELTNLHFLAVFTVAYNNLSGRIPEMKGQFSTFDNSSYDGNPFLCGPPLKNCYSNVEESAPLPSPSSIEENGKWREIDEVVFFASFSVSFVMFFFGVITLLYVNPYWRQRVFHHSEEFMLSCYYFLYDHFFKFVFRLYH